MAVTDDYKLMKDSNKIHLFTELLKLKEQKSSLEKRIKELEKGYKPLLESLNHDLFFELPDSTKFSIKMSTRKGNVDTDKMEADGIDVDKYRKPESTIYTLRRDK